MEPDRVREIEARHQGVQTSVGRLCTCDVPDCEIRWLLDEHARLVEEITRLRRIAAHVPAREWIKAKEAAGLGDEVHALAPRPATRERDGD